MILRQHRTSIICSNHIRLHLTQYMTEYIVVNHIGLFAAYARVLVVWGKN